MPDFVSWTAELTSFKNSIANRDGLTLRHRKPDGSFVEYRSETEIQQRLTFLEGKAAADAAASTADGTATRRSSFRPAAGGSW